MKRILTVFFVLTAAVIGTSQGQAQGPYGPPSAYGPSMGYAPMPGAPNPYGVAPHAQAGYAPAGYAPQGYPPPGYGPQGYAPQPPMGPPPGPQGGAYMPAAYHMQQPQPTPAMGYGPPPPQSYGGETMYGGPMYSDSGYAGGMCSDGFCSSCGANCGACDCGAMGLGGCGGWCFNPLRQAFGGLELLSWYRQGTDLPALVTTSPQGTTLVNAGVLGVPTTRNLLGDERVEDSMSGVRFTIGTWFDPRKEYGLVYRLTAPGSSDFTYSLASNANGVPTIARPYYDVLNDEQSALLIAFQDPVNGVYATGNVSVGVSNDIVNNDLYAMLMISKGCGWRTDFLFGYQNTNIDETLQIQSVTTVQNALFAPGFAVGTTFDVLDVLSVENEFHGGVVGLSTEVQHGPWSLRFLGKVGIGGTTSTATISGRTIRTEPTTPTPTVTQTDGGLLAQPTNTGTFEAESTTLAPEATLTLGYSCSQNLRLTAGYTFMYWTHIVPSNALIDMGVNPSQLNGGTLTGDPRPSPIIAGDTDFWVMGLNLGAEYRY